MWNEMQQVGTDYADVGEVERYEKRMGQFRDLAKEDGEILCALKLAPGARVLEIGTGTGHFARAAASAGHKVVAVDVSEMMLAYAGGAAKARGLTMELVHGGFLTFEGAAGSFDGAVTVVALHHLPDMWKAVALGNLRRVLKVGGRLVLRDVVFAFGRGGHAAAFEGFVGALPATMSVEANRHIAREYSTLDWIMEGLLERAGFKVEKKTELGSALVEYVCVAV
jgi:ubiquinone/menaquinone biosynthesis C-methylase UbiE